MGSLSEVWQEEFTLQSEIYGRISGKSFLVSQVRFQYVSFRPVPYVQSMYTSK